MRLTTSLAKLRNRPGYRYLVIGGSVYVLELLIIIISEKLGANAPLAIGVSFWVGLMASFGLQKLVTFGDKRLQRHVVAKQLMAFSLLVLFNFAFTLLAAILLAHVLPAVFIRTIAIAITTTWNFYLYKTRIFKITDKLVY